MNSLKKLKRLLSRVFLINYFKYNKLISTTATSSGATTSSHNYNEMHKATSKIALVKSTFGEIFMTLCNFCEIFLLILILLYAYYHSIWIIVFIAIGLLGIFLIDYLYTRVVNRKNSIFRTTSYFLV